MNESLIPLGDYCYTRENDEVIVCPYWEKLENGNARCNFLNIISEDGQCLNLIWDQVKECGINQEEDLND